jgi:hypothetical protein
MPADDFRDSTAIEQWARRIAAEVEARAVVAGMEA